MYFDRLNNYVVEKLKQIQVEKEPSLLLCDQQLGTVGTNKFK